MERAAAKNDNLLALKNPGVKVNPVCVFVYRGSASPSRRVWICLHLGWRFSSSFFLIIYDQWAVLKEVRSVGAFREGLYAPDRQLMTPKVTTSCSYIPFLSVNL